MASHSKIGSKLSLKIICQKCICDSLLDVNSWPIFHGYVCNAEATAAYNSLDGVLESLSVFRTANLTRPVQQHCIIRCPC